MNSDEIIVANNTPKQSVHHHHHHQQTTHQKPTQNAAAGEVHDPANHSSDRKPTKSNQTSGSRHCHGGHSCNPCLGHRKDKSANSTGSGGGGGGDNVSLDAYDLASPCCDPHCVPTRYVFWSALPIDGVRKQYIPTIDVAPDTTKITITNTSTAIRSRKINNDNGPGLSRTLIPRLSTLLPICNNNKDFQIIALV